MTKLKLTSAILGLGAAIIFTAPVQADDIIQTLPSYDSPGYDFVTSTPPAGATTIGTFTFTIPVGEDVTGITISGTFGNGDSPTTALSDYYLGIPGGDETEVPVAFCDDPTANCASGASATDWSATLTPTQILDLSSALAAGSIDFTYTWDTPTFEIPFVDQFVYAGPTTLDITTTPEPNTILFCLSGLAGIVVLRRRFRKV
ncbi:MAG TPA: hypothetical protein VME17_19070 [Bryobacteraceae bacterium]|nr:hypothetical protein [Bryobacteraceae bacterium]